MASKAVVSTALLISLNLIFFSLVSSYSPPSPPPPSPPSPPPPPPPPSCPIDTLKLRLCLRVLNVLDLTVGTPPEYCCPLIGNLVNLKAEVCLCTAIDLLGILHIPINLTAVLNKCTVQVPPGFQCPN